MISSCFGSFTEVIRVHQVNCINGKEMKEITEKKEFVQNSNFIVISIITDNNRVNQNMYRVMSNSGD